MGDQKAIEGLVGKWYDKWPLTPDMDKIRDVLKTAISSAAHFAWVAEEEDGEVRGVLIGLTSDNLWARKKNCHVVAWISEIAGEGVRLLREFTKFVKSRPVIRVAGFAPDSNDIDARAWLLAERLGFRRHGGAYLMFR